MADGRRNVAPANPYEHGCIDIPGIDTFLNCPVRNGTYADNERNRRLNRVHHARTKMLFASIGQGRRTRLRGPRVRLGAAGHGRGQHSAFVRVVRNHPARGQGFLRPPSNAVINTFIKRVNKLFGI